MPAKKRSTSQYSYRRMLWRPYMIVEAPIVSPRGDRVFEIAISKALQAGYQFHGFTTIFGEPEIGRQVMFKPVNPEKIKERNFVSKAGRVGKSKKDERVAKNSKPTTGGPLIKLHYN